MAGGGSSWSLATLAVDGAPVACLETRAACYRLAPSLARVGRPGATSVAALFEDWPAAAAALEAAASRVEAADRVEGARLAPILYPGKILCAGANYYDHLAEMGMPGARKEDQRLFFFMKPSRNAVVGEGASVRMPIGTKAFDWEIELALVIGRTARNVGAETALSHVAGWTVAIDFSARDHNRAPETFYKLDWVAGKANDTCCPLGPRITPFSALADPQDVGLKLWVNGELKQDGRSRDMIFSVAEQIATASRIMTLDPGDVLLTGTPAGVGVPRQTFLKVGDRVDAEIENIGRLSVTICEPR
ncbi:MAG: fumarylacetoacetate hydrolase family protein [Methylobacteriaceae bacterium]|nr:fumarylacetoacetate hydrolase family protein [Methylobacteriaceae bacterium]